MSINEVRIDGRIGKDAEIRYTSGGSCVVKFSIATTERKKSGNEWVDGETFWFDVEYWPKDDQESRAFTKGKYLCLKGRLKVDKWDAKDGTKQQRVKIVMREVESWEFVNGGQSQSQGRPQQSRPQQTRGESGPLSAYEDDIPFAPHAC